MFGSFADLIDNVDAVTDISYGNEFLCLSQQFFETKNIAYLCLNLPNPAHDNVYIHHTYSSVWEQCYTNESFANVDLVLKSGLASITPIDWSELQNVSEQVKTFFEVAKGLNVGKQGLTFTIRGGYGETAIFSINTDHDSREWLSYKSTHMSDLLVLATYFHEKILSSQEGFRMNDVDTLSNREFECLKWCAAGKSYWDTSIILGISERTVNFHMTTVRHKLNAMTNAQAVAKAIMQGAACFG